MGSRTTVEMTWEQVRRRRLHRSHLTERASPDDLVGVARDVCGFQAQVLPAAEMGIAARVGEIDRAGVQDALWNKRTLVKSWTLRGTLHLHPASELPFWTAVAAALPFWTEERAFTDVGIEPKRVPEVVEAIGDSLSETPLTRDELSAEVVARVGTWAQERMKDGWGHLLGPAAARGILCYGPNTDDGRVTFVRADRWIGTWEEIHPRAALRTLALRFLECYGPADHLAFAHWCRMKNADARELFDELGDEVVDVNVEGWSAKLPRTTDEQDLDEPGPIRLLPYYDAYVIGSHPRTAVTESAYATRVFNRGAGPYPVVVDDGRAIGRWTRKTTSNRVLIELDMFKPPTARQEKAVEEEAGRLGDFLGLVPDLSVMER